MSILAAGAQAALRSSGVSATRATAGAGVKAPSALRSYRLFPKAFWTASKFSAQRRCSRLPGRCGFKRPASSGVASRAAYSDCVSTASASRALRGGSSQSEGASWSELWSKSGRRPVLENKSLILAKSPIVCLVRSCATQREYARVYSARAEFADVHIHHQAPCGMLWALVLQHSLPADTRLGPIWAEQPANHQPTVEMPA